MIAISILFVVMTLVVGFVVMQPIIDDWFDEWLWAMVNRREYRRLSRANPHLRPETLDQMSRRAWEDYRRRITRVG